MKIIILKHKIFCENRKKRRQYVPPYSIVGGVPAVLIRKRFSEEMIDSLLKIKWWDWSVEKIEHNIDAIQKGDLEKIKYFNER